MNGNEMGRLAAGEGRALSQHHQSLVHPGLLSTHTAISQAARAGAILRVPELIGRLSASPQESLV